MYLIMESLDNPDTVSQPIDESITLTKPKKPKRIVTEKQLEAMKAGRELLKQNRELSKAKKILEAKEILEKYSQPKQEQILPIEPSIEEKEKEERKQKKKAPALKIPDDVESEEEAITPEIVIMKKKKKPKPPKPPKITYKYISDSESDSDDSPPSPPPQKQKGIQKPERGAQNKKQLRPVMQSIFCD